MRRRLVPLLCAVAGVAVVALLVYGLTQQGSSRALDQAVAGGPHARRARATRALPVLDGVPSAHAPRSPTGAGTSWSCNFWASWCDTCVAEAA